MISTRLVELVIDTVVCLTLTNWETVSGQFGGYLTGVAGLLTIIKASLLGSALILLEGLPKDRRARNSRESGRLGLSIARRLLMHI
jgi:hypothetical protein